MKRFYLILCATFVALYLQAVPAMPGKRFFTNPDGTTVEYEVRGDEFYHFMVDANNNMLEESADGFLKIKEKVSLDSVAARRARSKAPSVERIRKAGSVNLAPRGLFILVNFKDTKYQSSNTLAAMTEMINSTGHTYNFDGSPGSVRDYYLDQSDGQYNPQFDVYGPVTVSQNSSYYAGSGGTDNAYKMVIEACQSLNSQIDFSLYDGDNDGFVDFVYVIYAGKGQADGGGTSTIWPHQWYIYSGAGQTVELDGKKLDNYACGGELNGQTGHRYGIGTLCHEFGHVLGLPDYYDTNYGYNSTYGRTPGDWHIMDGGSYNNYGINPPNYAAHDKYFLGWYTPTVLKDPENVTLPADGQTYRMINADQTQQSAKSTNTIYYLENRQKTGWDAYLPGHGLLVWKVQYNQSVWQNNRPNYSQKNSSVGANLYYTVASATGSLTNIGTAKDPFPGTGKVTSYTPISGNALTDIEESNGTIYFKFNGGITRPLTVTFDAGEHATCETASLTQSSIGSPITLPDVTVTTPNYKFVGWSATEGSVSAEIGIAGETYIPTHDITLYAVVVPDGYWVRFNTETLGTTIGHGSCDVKDMRENGIGAGIVLPEFTPDPGYAFQFWVYLNSNNRMAYGGEAGETFYPSKDSMILYSYVYPSDSVFLTYDTYHVEKLSGPDGPWIKQGEALTATFVPASGYTFNSKYAQYEVKVDGEVVDGATALQNDTLTVSLTAEQVIYDVEIKAIAVVATSGGCEDYSYTYTSKVSGTTQVLNDVTWNITLGSNASISYNDSYGEMFGTSSTTTKSVQYVTSAFNDCDIQSITLTCGHTSNKTTGYATVAVYINGTQIGSQRLQKNSPSKTLTFTNSNNLKGEVKFVISNSNTDAFYVKAINVNMAPDPNAPTKLNVEYMQALNFTSGSSRLWQVDLTPLSTNYPDIMTWFYGNDMTTIAGSHQTLEVDYQLSESDEASYAAYEPICNITYLGAHPTNTSYPQYHVYMEWEDYATHDRYYIDSDVVGLLIDLDAYQNGDDYNITPTGDTNPVYYTVRHLLQDTEGDGYTLVATDTLHTAAGTSVTANTRSFTGFYSPQYQTKTVTTNYATVFEYKYDRMTLNVEFIVEGNVWQSEPVRYGAIPNYHGETPEKQASAQYTYTFTGWTPTLRPVRQADSYTALFEPSPRSYTITWLNDDGTEIDQTTVEYGVVPTHDDPTKEATAEFTFTFAGWSPEVVAVSGDATYTAQFNETAREYTITWIVNGESSTTQVAYGVVPETPVVDNYQTESTVYTFSGWTPEVVAVSGDATYTAQFNETAREYTITWIVNGESSTTQVAYGVVPETPVVDNYQTESTVYTFSGWSPEIVAVSGDATYTAQFNETAREYTITWLNDDGTLIDETIVAHGIVPTHDDPTKEATAEFTYTFAGWDPEVVAVTGDATYIATFTATQNTPTGIEQVIISGNSISGPEGMRVYNFNGQDVTGIKDHLHSGAFIIVVDGQSRKVMIP